jgi:flavin reductase (DIM6/NTAB) family NADH-FMN oxidoreductase RutF
MKRIDIEPRNLLLQPVDLWRGQWLLLAAGDFTRNDYNCMTVAWGGLGCMWDKPFALIVVRPTRHTWGFLERHAAFTLSAFGAEHRAALSYCGSHSGRDGDKPKACGLTPIASRAVACPGFEEATLILECRKIYFDDLDPSRFLDPSIDAAYPQKDYHRMYFGEILAASGLPSWERA